VILTNKQAKFVDEYLLDLNATQAAIRAGYSKKTAEWIGPNLLKKSHVADAISKAVKAQSLRTGITADRVLREIARIGFFDIRKLFGEDGALRPVVDLDDDTAASIAGLDVVSIGNAETGLGQVLKYKIASKNDALEKLCKHLGLYKDFQKDDDKPEPKQIIFTVKDARVE
jgi:phage terminase small subunit